MHYGATGILCSLCLLCIRLGLWPLQTCSKAVLSAFKIHRLVGLERPQKLVWYRYKVLAAHLFCYPNSKWWGAGLELLKAVLVASRMETRSQTFDPSSLFVDSSSQQSHLDPFTLIQNLLLLCLLGYHISARQKSEANVWCFISQLLSSASLQHHSALHFSYLVESKLETRLLHPASPAFSLGLLQEVQI